MQVLAHEFARGWQHPTADVFDMRRSYDRYYETGLYDSRYPAPNRHMLGLIAQELGPAGGRVLDFGCGSGRYALPLSRWPGVEVFGFDVSAAAIQELSRRCDWSDGAGRPNPRPELLCGSLTDLERRLEDDPGFDLVMLLFGVLGHIQGRTQRVSVLRSLRARLRPGGRLIATVPNRIRRFQAEQRAIRAGAAKETLEPGDIHYRRGDERNPIELYYHLYTPTEFQNELVEAGFVLSRLEPESVLPERAVLGSLFGAAVDGLLRRVTPLGLAYGFVAIAAPAAEPGLV
jgi:SAM-dependent methyltransferase